MKSEGKTRASSGPIKAELAYLEGLQHSIHVYFIAIRNRLIMPSVPVYLQPSLSPEQHFKTGSPWGPLEMHAAGGRLGGSLTIRAESYFGSLWLSLFICSPGSTLSPTCSVHPSLPSLGYLHTINSPSSHTGTPCVGCVPSQGLDLGM